LVELVRAAYEKMSSVPFPADKTCLDLLADGGMTTADSNGSGQGTILAFILSADIPLAVTGPT